MRSLKIAFVATLLTIPTFALAETGGAAAGAAAGGVAGAVVGGPVGAAVGAGVGGAAGDAATGPDSRTNVIIEKNGPAATGSTGCSSTTTQRTDITGETTTKQRTDC
jgi:hypothetical protein